MGCKNGCMDENTMIMMADGSQRSICQIMIGDFVHTEGENCNRVCNIWKGGEDSIIRIITKSGDEIKLSSQHPIKVNNNWMRAADVKVGDELHDAKNDRDTRVCAVESVSGYTTVYNLEFECANDGIFANGILVGDFKKQCSEF